MICVIEFSSVNSEDRHLHAKIVRTRHLCAETTQTWKLIAAEFHMGSWTEVSNFPG